MTLMQAFIATIELWIFIGILLTALVVEVIIQKLKQ